uniref:Uncharacterized protein n=1 Tax=Anguilla anguilla TaxID=7936 RepID=A0A0E9TGH1_ANGAN
MNDCCRRYSSKNYKSHTLYFAI